MKPYLGLFLLLAGCSSSKSPQVRIAIVTAPTTYLPVYLAHSLGYFDQEHLNVRLHEVSGTSKAMEALLGGSADLATSFYESAILTSAQGRPVRSFVTLLHNHCLVLVVSPASRKNIRRIPDLNGAVVGVTTLGSGNHVYLNHLLSRSGLRPDDATAIAVGTGAAQVAAFERGKVDALTTTGQVPFVLERRHRGLMFLNDTRTAEGLRATYGADVYPAHSVMARPEWLRGNPQTARKLSRAIVRALSWIHDHSAEEIRNVMPSEHRFEDAEADLSALRTLKLWFSMDGRMPPEGPEIVRRALAAGSSDARLAVVDLAATYTNEFLEAK